MADVPSRIKLRAGQWQVEKRALDELAKDEFTLQDVKYGILTTIEFDELTHDDSNVVSPVRPFPEQAANGNYGFLSRKRC